MTDAVWDRTGGLDNLEIRLEYSLGMFCFFIAPSARKVVSVLLDANEDVATTWKHCDSKERQSPFASGGGQ